MISTVQTGDPSLYSGFFI